MNTKQLKRKSIRSTIGYKIIFICRGRAIYLNWKEKRTLLNRPCTNQRIDEKIRTVQANANNEVIIEKYTNRNFLFSAFRSRSLKEIVFDIWNIVSFQYICSRIIWLMSIEFGEIIRSDDSSFGSI